MTEFKLSQELDAEVSALRQSGEQINSSFEALPSDGVDTLKTAMHYIQQSNDIKELMKLYAALLAKDAADLENMIATVREADQANSGGFR